MDIAAGHDSYSLAAGANSSRANQAHLLQLKREWEARFLSVGLSIGDGACLAFIEIDAKGTIGEAVKRGTIRGTSISGGLGSISWTGRVPITRDGHVFFLVRNDTGAEVTVGFVWSGIFLEAR